MANLRCFVVRQILSKNYALLRGEIFWSKMRFCRKMTNIRYAFGIQLDNLGIERFSSVALDKVNEITSKLTLSHAIVVPRNRPFYLWVAILENLLLSSKSGHLTSHGQTTT